MNNDDDEDDNDGVIDWSFPYTVIKQNHESDASRVVGRNRADDGGGKKGGGG